MWKLILRTHLWWMGAHLGIVLFSSSSRKIASCSAPWGWQAFSHCSQPLQPNVRIVEECIHRRFANLTCCSMLFVLWDSTNPTSREHTVHLAQARLPKQQWCPVQACNAVIQSNLACCAFVQWCCSFSDFQIVFSLADSRHFVLELCAGHANEMGILTLAFLALPFVASEQLNDTLEWQCIDSLYAHAATLRTVAMVLHKHRTGCGIRQPNPKQNNAVLLLLTPKQHAGKQSLASQMALECAKLRDDLSENKHHQQPATAPALSMFKLQSPEDVISPGGQLASETVTSERATPIPAPVPSTIPPATPRLCPTPQLWQKVAEVDSFDVEAWCREAQQQGRSSSEQVSDLAKIVQQFQDLLRLLAAQMVKKEQSNERAYANHASNLRTSQFAPCANLQASRESMASPRAVINVGPASSPKAAVRESRPISKELWALPKVHAVPGVPSVRAEPCPASPRNPDWRHLA